MRAFLLIGGFLTGSVALLFVLALLRSEPSARAALPPTLASGVVLESSSAAEAFSAWTQALPPPPVPLTTRYAVRAELLNTEDTALPTRTEFEGDIDLSFGQLGSLRLDLEIRTRENAEPIETKFHGSLILDGGTFWAWGDWPAGGEDFARIAKGKVVRLPEALLREFLSVGQQSLDGFVGAFAKGVKEDAAEVRFAELLHPARIARWISSAEGLSSMALRDGALQVELSHGLSAESLVKLFEVFAGDLPAAGDDAQMKMMEEWMRGVSLQLVFDPDQGLLLSGLLQLPEPGVGQPQVRGSMTVSSEASSHSVSASAFKPPAELMVFDLTPLANMGLSILRKRGGGADEF